MGTGCHRGAVLDCCALTIRADDLGDPEGSDGSDGSDDPDGSDGDDVSAR